MDGRLQVLLVQQQQWPRNSKQLLKILFLGPLILTDGFEEATPPTPAMANPTGLASATDASLVGEFTCTESLSLSNPEYSPSVSSPTLSSFNVDTWLNGGKSGNLFLRSGFPLGPPKRSPKWY